MADSDWGILDDIAKDIAAINNSGDPVFGNLTDDTTTRIPILDNINEIDGIISFKSNKPEAYLVYHGTTEQRDENNIDLINSVVNMTIVAAYQVKEDFAQENDRVQNEIQLKNDILNAIYADRGRSTLAHYLVVDGEAIYGTEAGEVVSEEIKAPNYKISIPVRCAYQHTATGR